MIKQSKFLIPRHLIFCCYMGVTVFLLSCNKEDCCPGVDPADPTLDLAKERQDLAIHVSNHFILPAYTKLTESIGFLNSSINDLKDAFTIERLQDVRSRTKEAWLTWQDASIYQMGPTENNALRAAINLYPIDAAKIESNIVNGNYTFGSIGNQGAEGLPALDYLVNAGSIEETLNQLQDEQRMDYLIALGMSLQTVVEQVATDWSSGSFTKSFISDNARGTDIGSAIGQLTNAIDLHFQRFLRDGKVAIPAGVRSAGVPRPKAVEAFYGGYSKALFLRALEAYVDLMEGNGLDDKKGTSFFSYLESINQQDLVAEIRSKFDAAFVKADPINDSFKDQIELDNNALIELFLSLQEIITLIKSDMASVIGITITNQDNDGD